MNAIDRGELLSALCRLWPRKFTDDELEDFYQRMMPYRISDVLAALDEFKSNNKFRPQVSEILGRLKGKDLLREKPRDLSHAQIIRRNWGLNESDMSDA